MLKSAFSILFSVLFVVILGHLTGGMYHNENWIVWWNVFILAGLAFYLNNRLTRLSELGKSVPDIYLQWIFLGLVLSIVAILLALFDLPSGYYIFVLRPILFTTGFLSILLLVSIKQEYVWSFRILLIFLILFNPISPIMLGPGTKYFWAILNFGYVVFLFFLAGDIKASLSSDLDSEYDPDGEDNPDHTDEEAYIDKQKPASEVDIDDDSEEPDLNPESDDYWDEPEPAYLPNNTPDISYMIYRQRADSIKNVIHLIVPILEEIESGNTVNTSDISAMLLHAGGRAMWADQNDT